MGVWAHTPLAIMEFLLVSFSLPVHARSPDEDGFATDLWCQKNACERQGISYGGTHLSMFLPSMEERGPFVWRTDATVLASQAIALPTPLWSGRQRNVVAHGLLGILPVGMLAAVVPWCARSSRRSEPTL